jgi:hypothetical protein
MRGNHSVDCKEGDDAEGMRLAGRLGREVIDTAGRFLKVEVIPSLGRGHPIILRVASPVALSNTSARVCVHELMLASTGGSNRRRDRPHSPRRKPGAQVLSFTTQLLSVPEIGLRVTERSHMPRHP